MVFNGKKQPPNTIPMTNVRFFFSPFVGVNHARNLGVVQAQGNIILFLDDDCRLQNKNYLRTVMQLHADNPTQMSIGGPYSLTPRASRPAQAYHHNRTEWLKTQSLSPQHSRALLGGNASYKVEVFRQGLRFSPGITYGGSETPFNAQVADEFGPHLFLSELTLEHDSRLHLFPFLKKAYLQGKGHAFQKKFHSPTSSESDEKTLPATFAILLLVWLYDFCFMVGYRTSIYERRFFLRSFAEEMLRRVWSPFAAIVRDIHAAHSAVFSKTIVPTFNSHTISHEKTLIPITPTVSLFRKLQTLAKKDLEVGAFTIAKGVTPDQIFADFERIQAFYGEIPETFSFIHTGRMDASFVIHKMEYGTVVFDPALSDDYKIWGKDRIENSKIKNSVYYFFTERKTFAPYIWPHLSNKNIYALDGVCVNHDLWNQYLASSIDPYNHFSWDHFVRSQNLIPQRDTVKVGSPNDVSALSKHAHTYFVNFPSRAFYKANMVLLGQNQNRRSTFLKFFVTAKKWLRWIPADASQIFRSSLRNLQTHVSHWQLEAQETSSLAYKWSAYALHKLYWGLHKTFWVLNEVYWRVYKVVTFVGAQIIWRTFDMLVFIYLVLNGVYWFFHAHVIGPAIGFARSLFEEPEHIRTLPLKDRYKQRLLLFAKKWAWLFLRGVRLR